MAGFNNTGSFVGVRTPFGAKRRAEATAEQSRAFAAPTAYGGAGTQEVNFAPANRAASALYDAGDIGNAREKTGSRMRAILAMGDAGFSPEAASPENLAYDYVRYRKGKKISAVNGPVGNTSAAEERAATINNYKNNYKNSRAAASSGSTAGGSAIAAAAEKALTQNGGHLGSNNIYNNNNGQSWCGYFVMSMAKEAGISVPNVVYVPDGVKEAKNMGIYRDAASYTPKPGDIVFVDTKGDGAAHHVGIVQSVGADGRVNTIEGNTSGGQYSSGCLMRKSRTVGGGVGAITGYAAI